MFPPWMNCDGTQVLRSVPHFYAISLVGLCRLPNLLGRVPAQFSVSCTDHPKTSA
ncbi:hypothetical protein [Alcaligenes aquatilis]|uniref:hypothetical protein n=1 Tax=Alcaligenes aquatilis TaxID=323284 RepID=UPI0013CEFEEC|nr:hypothetical protein [Alcaligenes aquatilis]